MVDREVSRFLYDRDLSHGDSPFVTLASRPETNEVM